MKNILPNKKEFLLSLVNNNYSQRTLESYARDLLIFELFLNNAGIEFDKISKLNMNEYKGYLKTGQHIRDLNELKKSLKNKKDTKQEEEQIEETEFNTDLILEKALDSNLLQKSRSKGDRNNSKYISGLNSRSINRMLSSFRSYLAFLIDLDENIPIPPSSIKLVKTEKKESQVADLDQLVQLIEYPSKFETQQVLKFRNRAILELLFSTGMRISEIVNLDIADINYSIDEKRFTDNKIYILGKGKKQRYVYLTDRAIFHVEEYLKIREDNFPALFIPYRGKRHADIDMDIIRISQRYVQSMIKKYRKLLGIQIPTTPHSLRHGFATYLAEKGANPVAIQKLLGHESLQTTTRYVHASDRFAEKSHHDYHPLN